MLNFSFWETYMYATCSNGSRNTFVTRAGRAAPNPARAPRVTRRRSILHWPAPQKPAGEVPPGYPF